MKVAYETDEILRKWFKKIFILTIITIENIDEFWINTIMPGMTQLRYKYKKIEGFTEYVLNNYFEGNFLIKYWNHFLTVGNRTNNHVEAYNLRLKKFILSKAPNIFKAIEVFQKEEVNSALKFERANNPDPKINKPPYRRHLDIAKEAELKMCQSLLKEGAISLEVYVEKVISFYEFYRKPEKESDSESDELSTDSSSDSDEE